MIVWWIIAALVILLAVIALSDTVCHLEAAKTKGQERIVIQLVALFGLVRYRLVISSFDMQGIRKGLKLKARSSTSAAGETTAKSTEKQRFTLDKAKNWKLIVDRMFEQATPYIRWLKATLKRVRCADFRWETKIGTGDAAETAILTGAGWGIQASLAGYVLNYLKVINKPRISVIPLYQGPGFASELGGTFRIRFFWVACAGAVLAYRYMRAVGARRAFRTVRSRAAG